ncbi:MAG: hypothetical protein VB139_03930 [Coriobacteriia bacterium]|nr:hypothetical protein [Coriobacteriia bacterium]
MWEPRVAVEGSAWFAVAYLLGAVAIAAAVVALMVRLRVPPRLFKFGVAVVLAFATGVFLWLLGSPVAYALLLGLGIVPVVLIAVSGRGYAPPQRQPRADAE